MRYQAAVVQITTTPDVEASIQSALQGVQAAAAGGAQLIALPETVSYLGPEGEKARLAEPLNGPTFERFAAAARNLGIHLLVGSLPERSHDPLKPYNTSVLFGPYGNILASYRKIHLFDVDLRPSGPRLAESDRTSRGGQAVAVNTELGLMGLTICYDVRFPELYTQLAHHKTDIIFVPSAFTVPTGAAHWEVLLRARAIENQCYIIAPAQYGQHWERRQSYGRSMIIDPWGVVLTTCPDRPAIGFADIDLNHVAELRRKMPIGAHRNVSTWSSDIYL